MSTVATGAVTASTARGIELHRRASPGPRRAQQRWRGPATDEDHSGFWLLAPGFWLLASLAPDFCPPDPDAVDPHGLQGIQVDAV